MTNLSKGRPIQGNVTFSYFLNKRLKFKKVGKVKKFPLYVRCTFLSKQGEFKALFSMDYETIYWSEKELLEFTEGSSSEKIKLSGLGKYLIDEEENIKGFILKEYKKSGFFYFKNFKKRFNENKKNFEVKYTEVFHIKIKCDTRAMLKKIKAFVMMNDIRPLFNAEPGSTDLFEGVFSREDRDRLDAFLSKIG